MKAKKIFALGLAVLISVSAVGCGTSSNSTSTTAETKTQSPDSKTEEQKVSIEFFQSKREAVDTFNALIKDFNAKYPNIEIKQNTVPNNPGQVVQARAASNDFPEVYLNWPTNMEFINYVKNGFIMDVTNEAFTKNAIPQIQKLYEIDGKMYGVPLAMNAAGIIYNKKIFKDAGIEVPKTWDEFIKVCDTLKSKNIAPIELTLKDGWTVGTFNQLIMHELMTDDMFQKVIKGEASLVGNKEWTELSEKTLKVAEYGQSDAKGTGYDQGIQAFGNEKAAMFLQGLWAISSIKKVNANIDIGTFPFPGVNDTNQIKVPSGVDVGLSISSKSKNPDACKTFISFLTSKEAAQKFSDLDKSISAIKEVKLEDPVADGLQTYFNDGKVINWLTHYWPAGAGDEYAKLLQGFIAKKDIPAFAKQMDDMFENIQK